MQLMANSILLKTSRFSVERVEYTTAAGEPHQREVIRHPGAATIIPMVDDTHICLIKNFRASVSQTLLELPAGTIDPPEPPEVTARRELTEETGYEASEIRLLHRFYLSPGILDERMHVYLATGLTAGPAAREPGELIENVILPFTEALTLIDDGTIEDAKTIAGLLMYERHRLRR
ncbi:MAG TPA: NUDIX hydrolase [Planctomycetaceae bacterium]|nr:NUDIX hydrolase [Blastopirellula sp.]HAY78520.1 NUDIX hydrolase [Planctomycetaceae bacterium]|tara:strand:- start:59 stop:586 length:528 start_codon:yes stop_codon:yes gene_type:complete